MLSLLLLAFQTLQAPPALGIERYEIDPANSTIGFDGTSPLHNFSGKTHAITGDLRADRADIGHLAGGAVWIDVRTLDTGNNSRDEEMRDLLGAKKFPQIAFGLDSVQGQLVKGRLEYTAQGRFTIKGVEKPHLVKFHIDPVAPAKGEPEHMLRVLGELRLDMTEHGVKPPGVLITKVSDELRIWLDLRLRPMPDAGVDALVRTLKVEEEFTPSAPGAALQKQSSTELAWSSGTSRLWERRTDPLWVLGNADGLVSIDPRSGHAQAAAELLQQAMQQLAQPSISGTTWSSSADEASGHRTLRITFADEVPARLPTWALDPKSWSNGPAPAAAR